MSGCPGLGLPNPSLISGSGSGSGCFGGMVASATYNSLLFSALARPPRAPLCALTSRFAVTFCNSLRNLPCVIASPSTVKYGPMASQTLGQSRPHLATRCSFFWSFGSAPPRPHIVIRMSMYAPISLASKSRVSPTKSATQSGMNGVWLIRTPSIRQGFYCPCSNCTVRRRLSGFLGCVRRPKPKGVYGRGGTAPLCIRSIGKLRHHDQIRTAGCKAAPMGVFRPFLRPTPSH